MKKSQLICRSIPMVFSSRNFVNEQTEAGRENDLLKCLQCYDE